MKIESIEQTKQLISDGAITADAAFLSTSSKALTEIVNGCGAANAKFDFVPDTIWFLYVGDCCNIHDLDYFHGETIEDKESADRRMLNNMIRLINKEKGWYQFFLKPMRRRRALKYYDLVDAFGGSAFWEGK